MADSFFGFNTSLSAMDEGSCLSDDEYDLLNDETFGLEASQCDWEDQHESFAKFAESKKKPKDDDLDLEASLSNLVLDDCVVPVQSDFDDSSVDLDPKVWASPEKPITHIQLPRTLCTVEEIERGLLRPNIAQHQIPSHHNGIILNPPPPPGLVRHFGPLQNQQRFPPGLPRHPVAHLPNNGPPPMRMLQHPNARPQLSHTLPAGLIYNSHMNIPPNFNRQDLSQTYPHCALNQHPMYQQKHQQNFQHNAIPNSNMTNQNMVQMIQQNHPLLQNFRNQQYNRMYNNHTNQNTSFNSHKNHNSNHGNQNMLYNGQFNAHLTNGGEVLDEYSNLMSARDKQWLINIQLMQLNTGTPYIDDYYYTVFTEKQNKIKGERETIAHKDNTLNHPLIQPKQPNRFNYNSGNNRSLDGQHRERRNSQSRDMENTQQQRTYTPLQFENSLGKLTCGSVTAPRKIIDMEMVSTEKDSLNLTSSEAKKCRQLLMMIESLYRTLLKLEDLSNPMAVATVKLVKEREEKQLQQLAEQRSRDPDVALSEVFPTQSKPDDKDELIASLLSSLDKISILSVRKGKILVLRILPHLDIIRHHLEILDFYCRMIRNLPQLGRKDQNTDNLLPRFYGHFKTFISHLECEQFVSIAESFTDIGEKGMAYCIGNKLGISMLSALLLQCELLHQESKEEAKKKSTAKKVISTIPVKNIPPSWNTFLKCMSNAFGLMGGSMQSPLEFVDRDMLYHHLERCPQLRSDTAKLVMFERAFVCLEQREN